MKRLVVLSGAGISADSGISTFRDSGGLWEGYDVMEVATPQAWENDYQKVLAFYNARRQNIAQVSPNEAHLALHKLEKHLHVDIITQNIDNLHELAGSSHVLHLHGEITKACSSYGKKHITDIGFQDILDGDLCPDGYQLRPFIVWFGEVVPLIPKAAQIVSEADILLIIGTSMEVYPAAGLVQYAHPSAQIFTIDPNPIQDKIHVSNSVIHIPKKASEGMRDFISQLGLSL